MANKTLYYLSLLACIFLFNKCNHKIPDSTNHIAQNSKSALDKPYLILVSLDGFRWDYVKRFKPPYLSKFIDEGVQAESLIPSFPSKTFPNHYTIATGMYPDHHGLVDNSFYDSDKNSVYKISDRSKVEDVTWYGGTPIWVQASKAGMVTASFFFVGSEADVQGIRPNYYFQYDHNAKNEDRVKQVLTWLQMPANERPHLITMYFSDMDDTGHRFGPNNDEKLSEALTSLDKHLGALFDGVKNTNLPINIMIVSDHGMIEIPTDQYMPVESIENDDLYKIVSNGAIVHIYLNDTSQLENIFHNLKSKENHFSVYKTAETVQFEYVPKNKKWGAIQVIPEKGWYFTSQRNIGFKKTANKKVNGEHGLDVNFPEMHGIFYANGPAFKNNYSIPSIKNIHLYPVMCKILRLEVPKDIDGKISVSGNILK